ncbi:glutaredoxin-3 (GRX3) [Vairimorpha necatrix]|uniref:Glutaredoxin-3 (GRX3) n=1 Tax=Vairimorpha necatrix TaxID=6039 RepID=A0AAX4JCS8_9MICR
MEYNKEKNVFYEIDYSNKVLFYENELPHEIDDNIKLINVRNQEFKEIVMEKYKLNSIPALMYYKQVVYLDKENLQDLKLNKDNLLRNEITRIINSAKIVLFMKGEIENPYCQFSRKVVSILKKAGVNLEDVVYYDILMNEEVREKLKEMNDWPTFPQMFVNGEFIGGCDILTSMDERGEIYELLN